VVWELCRSLWGKLSSDEVSQGGPESHETTMDRKEKLSQWLKSVVRSQVHQEVSVNFL